MAIIVIAYTTYEIDGKLCRIYNDSTEKFFESADQQDAKDYMNYLASSKGYTLDISEITIYKDGELDVDEIYRKDALGKLTDREKQILGIPNN